MKLSFKNIIIIFLVGLLGGVVGTFGVIEINKATGNKILERDSQVIINEVKYPSTLEKSSYSLAAYKAINSVVEITSTVQTQSFFGVSTSQSLGSGVIVSSDGYIVTNNHVVSGAINVSVKLYDGTSAEASLIGTDPRTDLAVIKIEKDNLPYSTFADSSELLLGQECIAIGNPLGQGITCVNGIVSALEKDVTISNYSMTLIQTNAAVNAGNSGGGLFNMNGDLIGIVNAKSSSSSTSIFGGSSPSIEGIGYAIPSNTVSKIIRDLVDNGYVKNRATLGISFYSSSLYETDKYSGLLISTIQEDSGAQKAGIQSGDILSAVDDIQITSYSKLVKILDNYSIGDAVKLTIYRNDEKLEFNVTLGEANQ